MPKAGFASPQWFFQFAWQYVSALFVSIAKIYRHYLINQFYK